MTSSELALAWKTFEDGMKSLMDNPPICKRCGEQSPKGFLLTPGGWCIECVREKR